MKRSRERWRFGSSTSLKLARVAVLEHHGPPELEHQTARRLIEWRRQAQVPVSDQHRSYGVHNTDPRTVPRSDHRVDFCVSVDQEVQPNPQGVITKIIPGGRCAVARHLGSRKHNSAAVYLWESPDPMSAFKTVQAKRGSSEPCRQTGGFVDDGKHGGRGKQRLPSIGSQPTAARAAFGAAAAETAR
jgi:AraC family transcriptional regulator